MCICTARNFHSCCLCVRSEGSFRRAGHHAGFRTCPIRTPQQQLHTTTCPLCVEQQVRRVIRRQSCLGSLHAAVLTQQVKPLTRVQVL